MLICRDLPSRLASRCPARPPSRRWLQFPAIVPRCARHDPNPTTLHGDPSSHSPFAAGLAATASRCLAPRWYQVAPRKTYPDFAGRYDYKTAVLTVSFDQDHLYAQLTGQEKYEIFPTTNDAFFWKITDAQVAFLRNDKGEVIAARHTQAGNTFRAARIADSEIKLTAAELDAILGQYQYGPATILTVTRDGPSVFAQLTGQPKIQIYPKSATEFEWRVVSASVVFKKDGDGKVTQATHSQNGATFDAPKIK